MQPRSIKLGSPNAATGQCHDALQAALEMTAKPGLPGFPEVATACQHGRLSHTILYPSRLQQILQEFKWYSFVGLQGTQKRTDHAVVQYHCGSHMVFEWGCTAGDKAAGVLRAIRSRLSNPATSFVFTHRQFSSKEGSVQFACVEEMLIFMCQWNVIAKRSGLTTNDCGHGSSIWWTHCQIDVCQSCCWMPTVGRVLSAVTPWVWRSRNERISMVRCIITCLLSTLSFLPETHTMDASHATVALIMCACHRRCGPEFGNAVSSTRLEKGCKSFPAQENANIGLYWCALNMSAHIRQVLSAPCGTQCVWLKVFCRVKAGSRFWQLSRRSVRKTQSGNFWSLVRLGPFGTSSTALSLKQANSVTAKLQQDETNRATQPRLLKSFAKLGLNWQPCQSESCRRDITHTKTSATCLSVGELWLNTGGDRESWMCWQSEIGRIVKCACWMSMVMPGFEETWLRCGPRRGSFLEKRLVPRTDAIANLCGGDQITCSGRLSSNSLVPKVGVKLSPSDGSTLSAMRTQATWWSMTQRKFALMRLLIFLLCVGRCVVCDYEKQCQRGPVQWSYGDSCCIRGTCERSCDAEWALKLIHWDILSRSVWWGSCDLSGDMDDHLPFGTEVQQLRSISITPRVGLPAFDLSTCWVLWAGLFTTTCGRPATMLLKETMLLDTPVTGADWSLSCSSTAWDGVCEKQKFHTTRLFMMRQMSFILSTTQSWTAAFQLSLLHTTSACCCNATERLSSAYMEWVRLLISGLGPGRFKVREYASSLEPPRQFVAWDVVNNKWVEAAFSAYPDDIANKLTGRTAREVSDKSSLLNDAIDHEFSGIGLAQNRGKQEHVPFFAGPGARTEYAALFRNNILAGQTVRATRYLGPRYDMRGSLHDELQHRMGAARLGWVMFGRFWSRV